MQEEKQSQEYQRYMLETKKAKNICQRKNFTKFRKVEAIKKSFNISDRSTDPIEIAITQNRFRQKGHSALTPLLLF